MSTKNEGQWYDEILDRMLSAALEKGLDTRESSVSYQLYAPVALELAAGYVAGELAEDNAFVDTADLSHLILKAQERGLAYLDAMPVRLEIQAEAAGDIPIGERFSDSNGTIYAVSSALGDGAYEVTAETAGALALPESGDSLAYLGYRSSVLSATVTRVTDSGRDAETADQLRTRYYESLNALPFGGNAADYRDRTLSLPGVGGVQVRRAWNGAGTVKLLLLGSGGTIPDAKTVQAVQAYFDPLTPEGQHTGEGAAPVGHEVTAQAVLSETVSVETHLALEEGTEVETVRPAAEEALRAYFAEVAGAWAKNGKGVLRVGRVESALSSIPGVLESYDTLLGGAGASRVYAEDTVPVLGEVTLFAVSV